MVMSAVELLMLAILSLFALIGIGMISFAVWYSGKADKDYSRFVSGKAEHYVS